HVGDDLAVADADVPHLAVDAVGGVVDLAALDAKHGLSVYSPSAARRARRPRATKASRLRRFFLARAVARSSRDLSRRTAMVCSVAPSATRGGLALARSHRAFISGVSGFARSATNSSSNCLVASRSSSVVISQYGLAVF